MSAYYLTCNHCKHANEVISEYLTFCGECGKKMPNNYNDWKKDNSGKSFHDFKSIACHTAIFYWEPESKATSRKVVINSALTYSILAAILLSITAIAAVTRGPGIYNKMEDWALRQIQFGGSDTDTWETTRVPDGNFQVKFPVVPTAKKEFTETLVGNIEQCTYSSEPPVGEDDNLVYEVSYLNYPAEVIQTRVVTPAQTEQFLRHAIEAVARTIGGQIRSEKNIVYGLFQGKEVRLDYQEGMAEIKFRCYLIGNALYTLKVTSVDHNANNKAREYFLNSFKLLTYAQSSP